MPICHRHKFIFIHIPKTGGTSIRYALTSAGAELDIDGKLTESSRTVWLHHLPAMQLRPLVDNKIWQSYFKFGFVRNPWERLVSFYHFHKSRLTLPSVRRSRPDLASRFDNVNSFEEWLLNGIVAQPCAFFLCDTDGEQIVDFVGRFESLDEDFSRVCTHLGIRAELPHLKRSDHGDYRQYYSRRLANRVAEHFKADIDRFGYTFNSLD